ncbi:hypothetical protein KEM52_004260 [Ascosphaera acerosa]|nr:hypothetical protein KEM52_004260 [Ascosphaera acerosa]
MASSGERGEAALARAWAAAEAGAASSPASADATGPLRDPAWVAAHRAALAASVRRLNDRIRGYNLVAPGPAHRAYLDLDRELERCYAVVNRALPELLEEEVTGTAQTNSTRASRKEQQTDQTGRGFWGTMLDRLTG